MITNEEIVEATNGLGEKGIASDLIAHWVPKLLVRFAPEAIIEIYRQTKLLNSNFSPDNETTEKLNAELERIETER